MERKLVLILMLAASMMSATGRTVRLPKMNVDSMRSEAEAMERGEVMTLRSTGSLGGTGRNSKVPYSFGKVIEASVDVSEWEKTTKESSVIYTLDIEADDAKVMACRFSKFKLAAGDSLYIIGSDGTVIGPLTGKDNLQTGELTTSVTGGDRLHLILKTTDNEAKRELCIGDVTYGFRDIRVQPVQNSGTDDSCSLYIMDELSRMAQGTCLLTYVSESTAYLCSGSLVNNADGAAKPYILTASHCIDTDKEAQTVVAYFNYASPLGNSSIRGSMETYIVGSTLRACAVDIDFSLLELPTFPAKDFRPYMNGINAGTGNPTAPVHGIHHPSGTVRRFTESTKVPTSRTYQNAETGNVLYSNGHWNVSSWSTGTTEGGSSGSPLFDSKNRIIGALSGGSSTCLSPVNDLYYKMSVAWDTYADASANLMSWLAPDNAGVRILDGVNPYGGDSARCLTNLTAGDDVAALAIPEGATEIAQGFSGSADQYIYGVYVVSAVNYQPEKIDIYSGSLDGTPIYSHTVEKPIVAEWSTATDMIRYSYKTGFKNAYTFIRFNTPVAVSGDFYVACQVGNFVPYAATTTGNTAGAYALIDGVWTELTATGITQNATWIDAVVSNTDSGLLSVTETPTDGDLRITPSVVKKGETLKITREGGIHGNCEVTVYDIGGRTILGKKTSDADGFIELKPSGIESGVYILQISDSDSIYMGKLIVSD